MDAMMTLQPAAIVPSPGHLANVRAPSEAPATESRGYAIR